MRAVVGDFLQSRLGHRADEVDGAKFLTRRVDVLRTIWRPVMDAAHGRHHHRYADLVAEKTGAGIDLPHVAADPRPKGETIDSQTVASERGFAFRGATDVIPIVLAQIPTGQQDHFVRVVKICRHEEASQFRY